MPKPNQLFYVSVFTKGLPPEKRFKNGRHKGGVYTRREDAVDFFNRRKAEGATVRFYVSEVEWQELDHNNFAELE